MMGIDGGMSDGMGGLCPVLSSEKAIDEHLNAIKRNLLSKEDTIAYLREELKKAKDEAYAAEEMTRMKEELDRTRKDLYRGFPIDEDEDEQVRDWQRRHETLYHKNPKGYHGAIGGGYTYKFYPTSIGVIGTCYCDICHREATIAAVKDGKYDSKAYQDRLAELNGSFVFQDL